MNEYEYIAHFRRDGEIKQSLEQHLQGVAILAKVWANDFGLPLQGEILGLLHDLGKYSDAFQNYISSAEGLIDPDTDNFIDYERYKGKIDHSSAGAQYLWQTLSPQNAKGKLVGQILSLCIASHHSGLIDCLKNEPEPDKIDNFSRRMNKPTAETHLEEILPKIDIEILKKVEEILQQSEFIDHLYKKVSDIITQEKKVETNGAKKRASFQCGLLIRLLFSCLIDADRQDSADFENPKDALLRNKNTDFTKLVEIFDAFLKDFPDNGLKINQIRKNISGECFRRASDPKGLFTLTVPTGGGKTLASLRFALQHASVHKMKRIIYVIPFTSIIDQNAEVTNAIFKQEFPNDVVVLEHHSNISPEEQSFQMKILSQNWDAPIVYTTMVQFLDTLFGSGTRGARRMHQLVNAVIVFDEIQTIPTNCIHMFNNAINFLGNHCGSSVVLCTATQPLLNMVSKEKGCLSLTRDNELMPDVGHLFSELERVETLYLHEKFGWSNQQIIKLIQAELQSFGSCLVIVNTKQMARDLFKTFEQDDVSKYHLSTSMCPKHRRDILEKMRKDLHQNQGKILCISTQLIEAGVDVDFGAVIRAKAGLDSIAQAAGRCNRNAALQNPDGSKRKGRVSIINPKDENLQFLPSIKLGQECFDRVWGEFIKNTEKFENNVLGLSGMELYFRYYFEKNKEKMDYPVMKDGKELGRLYSMLSTNDVMVANYLRVHKTKNTPHYFHQAFMTAGKYFEVIDAPTRGILVPYQEGNAIIEKIIAVTYFSEIKQELKKAQQYIVNVFPYQLRKLIEMGLVRNIRNDVELLYLLPDCSEYYNQSYGLVDASEDLPIGGNYVI